jgi:hypothetical protein
MDIETLADKLYELSSWRTQEISYALRLADVTLPDTGEDKISYDEEESSEVNYLRRSLIVILYAHCDGFLKEATRCYLEYIKHNEPKWHATNIAWIAIKSWQEPAILKEFEIGKLLKKTSTDYIDDIFTTTDRKTGAVTSRGTFEFLKKNFSDDFLRKVYSFILQIPSEHAALAKSLKLIRDQIAHGEKVTPSKLQCGQLAEGTLKFLGSKSLDSSNSLSSQILDHCTKKMAA